MLYKKFQDIELSALGLGCMRFPVLNGDDGQIDEAQAEAIVRCAMERGVNYYDTAWPYHKGRSEPVMGRILSKYPREAYYLATKFPGYLTENFPKAEEIFASQLERCRVDYFDFHLFHSVSDGNIDGYLDPRYGIIDFFREQKKAGAHPAPRLFDARQPCDREALFGRFSRGRVLPDPAQLHGLDLPARTGQGNAPA